MRRVFALVTNLALTRTGLDLNDASLFSSSPDNVWQLRPQIPATQGSQSFLRPNSFTPAVLDPQTLNRLLSAAPLEFTNPLDAVPVELTLPTPDFGFARFSIFQSPIMEPGLAAQFPEIKTFRGQGIDDPAATLRFDVSSLGFHAQVLSPNGAYYIDPFWHLDTSAYVSYYKRDLMRDANRSFGEDAGIENRPTKRTTLVQDSEQGAPDLILGKTLSIASGTLEQKENKTGTPALMSRSGSQLRTYRLANAATGEYTAFFGGTVSNGQAAIVTAINRVTGIYEVELSARLVLVANNASLIYTNAATDPYTNNDPFALLDQNQANIDLVIGNANYDIGHVFSSEGGGLAGLGVVGVTGSKARGETGSNVPINDPFYVDYVAHEMGHQFGGNHTFNGTNGSCSGGNRNGSTAYEPGSGTTIQAYAGICGADDLQPNSDPYFHSISFDEIYTYTTTGSGNGAATITDTGNTPPRVNAGGDHVIPARTPFKLSGAGVDSNSGDILTYNWEQRDLGPAQAANAADNGTSPLFRSFNPTTNPERTLPKLSDLLNNVTTIGEKLPTTTRTLKFRAIVRDNRSGGGGLDTDDMQISVVNTGTAFAVTAPNTAVTWAGGSTQNITWDVAGTTAAPINTTNVNIRLSTNGGVSFPILLAANTPNDGSHSIVVPNLTTSTARIQIEAANSIYFDVSNTNFSITGSTNTAPTVSDVVNRLIDSGASTGSIPFTVSDAQTAAANLVLAATSSNLTLVPNSAIVLGGSGANRTITVSPPPGQFGQARISIQVSDAGGLTTHETFELFVEGTATCSAYETFDGVTAPALPAGWTRSTSSISNWVTSSSSSASAPNNAFITSPTTVHDVRLTSPVIAVSQANQQFRFRNNYELETAFDGGVLEIAIDGGAFADFVVAGGSFATGGYNSVINTGFNSPIGGRSAWSGSSSGYIDTTADLPTSAMGKNIQLRWRFGSDSSVAAFGWRIDSIQACGIQSLATPILTITSGNRVYNQTAYAATASISGASGVAPGITFAYFSDSAGTNPIAAPIVVGSYFVQASSAANATNNAALTAIVPFQITPFSIVGSVTAANKSFDGTTAATLVTRTLNGVFDGDVVNYSGGTANFDTAAVGTNKVVTATGLSLTGTDAGNYSVNSTAITNADITPSVGTIAARSLFYNNATGANLSSEGAANNAIANNKSPLLPGQTSSFTNYTNYSRGLNGLIVDISNLPATTTNAQMLSSLAFAQWNGISATGFAALPAAAVPTVTILQGSGSAASARVKITFPDNSIQNTWLRVTVVANAQTGLNTNDVFYFGNVIGEFNAGNTATRLRVNATDTGAVRSNQSTAANSASVTNIYDVNRDGRVNATDTGIVRSNQQTAGIVAPIVAPAAAPLPGSAPQSGGGGFGRSSAMATSPVPPIGSTVAPQTKLKPDALNATLGIGDLVATLSNPPIPLLFEYSRSDRISTAIDDKPPLEALSEPKDKSAEQLVDDFFRDMTTPFGW